MTVFHVTGHLGGEEAGVATEVALAVLTASAMLAGKKLDLVNIVHGSPVSYSLPGVATQRPSSHLQATNFTLDPTRKRWQLNKKFQVIPNTNLSLFLAILAANLSCFLDKAEVTRLVVLCDCGGILDFLVLFGGSSFSNFSSISGRSNGSALM